MFLIDLSTHRGPGTESLEKAHPGGYIWTVTSQTPTPRHAARKLPSSRILAAVFLLLLGAAPAPAQSLRNENYASEIKQGIDHLYRLEYDAAIRFFSDLGRRFPHHPGPPVAQAVAIWLRELFRRQELDLDSFLSPGYFTRPSGREMPEENRKAYFDLVDESSTLAERYLEEHPGDKEARYYLGAVEGARGVFALTIERSYMQALKHGKKAYQYQKAIIEEDPDFADSYMTVGTYEYVLGNLPWYIKWIAALAGYRGSEQRGFEYLVRAARDSWLVYNEARVLLMVLYVREGEHEYALEVANQLHHSYPENYLLHLNRAQILERMGERNRAADLYQEVVGYAEEGRKNYQTIPIETFRYTTGIKLLELNRLEKALDLFAAAIGDPATPPRERALSHLKAGEILDRLGKREEAVSHYQRVQQMEEFEDSHKVASRNLAKPLRKP